MLRERLKGLAVAALVGAGTALVRIGAKLDGLDPDPETDPDVPIPFQDPLTAESFDLLDRLRPRTPMSEPKQRPLQGSAQERYARARERSGL